MPFINVKMIEGRTTDQKRELAKALTDAIVEICGAKREGTMVVIEDHAKEDWAVGGGDDRRSGVAGRIDKSDYLVVILPRKMTTR